MPCFLTLLFYQSSKNYPLFTYIGQNSGSGRKTKASTHILTLYKQNEEMLIQFHCTKKSSFQQQKMGVIHF